jgi:predicted transposase
MRLIAGIRLLPTPQQADALKRTLETANAACDSISQVAWQSKTFRQFALHKLTYQTVRETFHLAAQLAVRSIAKVADAYKLDRKLQRTFQPHGAVPYDDRILSYNTKGSEVSIWTLDGRQAIAFTCGVRQRALLATQRGETDLALVRGKWYLFVACEIETPEPIDAEGALGVDLGIVTLATDSDGEAFSGQHIERRRQWYAGRRQALQKVGTKSSKRRLRQLRGRQRRFQSDTNHLISKRLVAKAERTKRAIPLKTSRVFVSGRGLQGVGNEHGTAIGPLDNCERLSTTRRNSQAYRLCWSIPSTRVSAVAPAGILNAAIEKAKPSFAVSCVTISLELTTTRRSISSGLRSISLWCPIQCFSIRVEAQAACCSWRLLTQVLLSEQSLHYTHTGRNGTFLLFVVSLCGEIMNNRPRLSNQISRAAAATAAIVSSISASVCSEGASVCSEERNQAPRSSARTPRSSSAVVNLT